MNKFLFALMSSLLLLSCNGSKTEMTDLVTTKTKEHVHIPGTRMFIIPPKGFKVSDSFFGLQKGMEAVIQVNDLIGGDFAQNAGTFTEKNFTAQGLKVLKFNEFKLNGFDAKYAFIKAKDKRKMISLVFGDHSFCVAVSVIHPTMDQKFVEEIVASFKTIYYDKKFKVNAFDTAPFTLDDSNSIFKFAKSSAGIFIYSLNGNQKDSYINESFITINTVPNASGLTAQNIAQTIQQSVANNGFQVREYLSSAAKKINGNSALEVEIMGFFQGQNCILYQLVVPGKTQTICLQGILKSDLEMHLTEVKNLTHTLRLK